MFIEGFLTKLKFESESDSFLENTGCFFHWYPPKKYGKPRLGESTLT